MKKKLSKLIILLVVFSCISLSLFAKEPLSYQKVIELPGLSKQEIYDSSNQTLAIMFENSKFAIQYQNFEKGTIIANCHDNIKFNFMVLPTDFKMTINIKDEKIRVTFSEIATTATVGRSSSTAYITNEKALNDFKKEGDKIITSLINGIKNKSSDEDW